MYIHARVYPESKKPSLETDDGVHFIVRVKEKAEHNMANRKTLEMLAEYFDVSPKTVRIVNGHRSPSKLISLSK